MVGVIEVSTDFWYNLGKIRGKEIIMSADELTIILNKMVHEYKRVYGDKLKVVYLYGSYARGDFDEYSDVDIVGIVDLDYQELNKADGELIHCASELGLEYNILISPTTIPEALFIQYQEDLPYYRNIKNEGVVLIAW